MIENTVLARGAGARVNNGSLEPRRKPEWLKRPAAYSGKSKFVARQCASARLSTVCDEAKCPNKPECWSRGSATFLMLGATCTRACRFCNVTSGAPGPVDDDEPRRLCDTVNALGLRHVVVTSVTRDDLEDGGAAHFARTVRMLRGAAPQCTVEILVPDFNGNEEALKAVVLSGPDVFNHNIETVERLYSLVRPQASYKRSLGILMRAAERRGPMLVKSGLMVGFGEAPEEVETTLRDLHRAGCSVVTIGQYLQPSKRNIPVHTYVDPDLYKRYETFGRALGFTHVFSGPYIRSSYRASEVFSEVR